MTAIVLGTLPVLAIAGLVSSLCLKAILWLAFKAYKWAGSPEWGVWSILLLAFFLASRYGRQMGEIIFDEVSPKISKWIGEQQDRVLKWFDRSLKHPIPMFCVRFRRDEALIGLAVSRLLVKPIRALTVVMSYMVVTGGFLMLFTQSLAWLIVLPTDISALVFGTKVNDWVVLIVEQILPPLWGIGVYLFSYGVGPTIVLFIAWTILGSFLSSMTLGHWGGILDQLLVDFRITGTPDGASATSKVYSLWRGRRTLLVHSLTYHDRIALAEISDWLAARMRADAKTSSAAGRSV